LKLRPLLLVLLGALPWLAGCSNRNLTTPQLYRRHCARCHGERGEGNPRGLRLYPHLDFRASPLIRDGDRVAVRHQIADGEGPMPGFARRLTPQQIERLVDFTFQLGLSPQEKP
jgi:mono/diheme cytochrome c family protein